MSKLSEKIPKRVKEGLEAIAARIEAGCPSDFVSYEEDQMDAEALREWRSIQAACEWIWELK